MSDMRYEARIENEVLVVEGVYHQGGGWLCTHTIEHGWKLYEVPLHGGYPMFAGYFDTFPEAKEYAEEHLI